MWYGRGEADGQPELFQDDIYADTIDVEVHTTSAQDWLKGTDMPAKKVSLKPEGMALRKFNIDSFIFFSPLKPDNQQNCHSTGQKRYSRTDDTVSQAPKTSTASTRKFIPAADILSEEEKKRREMDALFQKAKLDESSDEEDQGAGKKGLDPPDDDW